MTLAELKKQRDALDKEIKDREKCLYELSVSNMTEDLPITEMATLEEAARAAAALGLVLTTTKERCDHVPGEQEETSGGRWVRYCKVCKTEC